MENLTDLTCLYSLKVQKEFSRGITEKPFIDVNCIGCSSENQSSIACGHYINQAHLDFFKKTFEVKG